MKITSNLLKCILFFALPRLSFAAINMEELEAFSKNLDTRFIETKRSSLAEVGWYIIKEGADSTDDRIIQLNDIFDKIIDTPWIYSKDMNDVKVIYDQFKDLSFTDSSNISNVLDHFNNIFTNNFEFNFLKSLFLERKFLDEIKTDVNAFISNRIPDEDVFKEELKKIEVFIDENYKVGMLFKDRANSFCLDRRKLIGCLKSARDSDKYKGVGAVHKYSGKITGRSVTLLRWLCAKRKNVSESDFLILSILRNSLLDNGLKGGIICYFYYRTECSTYTLARFIQAYGKALEKDLQSIKDDIPFLELRLSDDELESSESESTDVQMNA